MQKHGTEERSGGRIKMSRLAWDDGEAEEQFFQEARACEITEGLSPPVSSCVSLNVLVG
jgi:hypothetical protein